VKETHFGNAQIVLERWGGNCINCLHPQDTSEGETLAGDTSIAVLAMLVFDVSGRSFLLVMAATPSGCSTYPTAFESLIQLALLLGYIKYSELTCN
jgi:hypothetical protein